MKDFHYTGFRVPIISFLTPEKKGVQKKRDRARERERERLCESDYASEEKK